MNSISMEETVSIMLPGNKSSKSPVNSAKRKSFENDENANSNTLYGSENTENATVKKAKLSNLPESSNSVVVDAPVTTSNGNSKANGKSSLPRLSTKRIPTATQKSKIAAPSKEKTAAKSPPVPPAAPTTPARYTASHERGTDKKQPPQIDTSITNSIPQNPTTPMVKISSNPLVRKVQRDLINEVTGNYFTGLFDQHIASLQTDEKIATAISSLKVKSKWDIKEKMKKQENVLKEMKDIIVHLQDGINQMKYHATNYESKIQTSLREVYDQLVDNIQQTAQLQTRERELKKVNDSLAFENKSLVVKYDNLKNDSQQQVREVEMSMLLQTKEKERLVEKINELESQLAKIRKDHEETIQHVRESQDKHAEEKMKLYHLEITTLKQSLEKLQLDFAKVVTENEEWAKKNATLQEDILQLKSDLKDAEVAKDMLDRDVSRLTQEVQHLKDSLNKRDDDFRSSMTSAYTIQKQALEEKNTLWNEISQLNNKAQNLEDERRQLVAQISGQKEEFSLLMKDYESLKEQKSYLECQLSERKGDGERVKELSMQLEIEKELKIRFESREESERRERIAAVAQLIAIQNESNKTLRDMEGKLSTLERMKDEEIIQLKQELEQAMADSKHHAETSMGLKHEIQQLHIALEKAPIKHEFAEELSRARGEIEVLKQKLHESQLAQEKLVSIDSKRVAEYEEKLQISEAARRKLHNLVQELRGNIRVFARVRPFLPGDGHDLAALPEPAITTRTDLNSLKIIKTAENDFSRKEEHDFAFDKVFGPSVSQETLFHEVAEFVQSALDGYNVCLFSYGQTGSGKTHTMNGSGDGSMRGIIPRAMEQVGAYKRQLQEKGWNYSMEISFIEIYNENIRDLLRSHGTNNSNASNTNNSNNSKEEYSGKHDIKKDAQGNVYVTDINKIPVDPEDVQQIISIMELAAQYRSTSSTLMNDRSSRSHAIFTLYLKAFNPNQGIELNGALNLVDLAGSERIDKSGVSGHELKEAVAINKSLSSLADVFTAIANKQPHVPFRNSKLTYLLQPALSGDGKTLMIVNLSPTEASFHESLSSLRFASQVSQCELGKPKRKLRDVTGDKDESQPLNKRVMINTSSVPVVVNKSLSKASSFTIATPSPTVPIDPKLAISLGSGEIAAATTTNKNGIADVSNSGANTPSSRVTTPNRVRFGGATTIKPPTGTSSGKMTSKSVSSSLGKTSKLTTPSKGKSFAK